MAATTAQWSPCDCELPPLMLNPPPGYYEDWWHATFDAYDGPNAADGYRRALAAYDDDQSARDAVTQTVAPWDAALRPRIVAWVERNADALALAERAAQIAACHYETHKAFDNKLLDNDDRSLSLPRLHHLAKCLFARGHLAAQSGDPRAAVADVGMLLHMANHLEQQRRFMEYAVAMRVRLMAYGAVTALLDTPLHAKAGDILHALDAVDAPIASPRMLTCEAAAELLNAATRYGRDVDGDGRLDEVDVPGLLGSPELSPPRTLAELSDELFALLRSWSRVYASQVEVSEAHLTRVLAETSRPHTLGAMASGALFESGLTSYQYACYARNWCRAMLCLHVYQDRHGQWPVRLWDVLENPAAIVDDPYGGTLQYELRDGRPCVYSGRDVDLRWVYPPPWQPPACASYERDGDREDD